VWAAPGQTKTTSLCVFVILVTQPKSYIETTDRRISAANRHWWWGRVLSWKIPEFWSVGGADPKTIFFRVLGYPSTILARKQFYPKPMVPMESRDYEGVPFSSLESLWPGILEIWAPELCRKVVTWPSRKLGSCISAHAEKFTDSKNAIRFDLRRNITKLSRKTRFRTVASPGACARRLAVLTWRLSVMLLVQTGLVLSRVLFRLFLAVPSNPAAAFAKVIRNSQYAWHGRATMWRRLQAVYRNYGGAIRSDFHDDDGIGISSWLGCPDCYIVSGSRCTGRGPGDWSVARSCTASNDICVTCRRRKFDDVRSTSRQEAAPVAFGASPPASVLRPAGFPRPNLPRAMNAPH